MRLQVFHQCIEVAIVRVRYNQIVVRICQQTRLEVGEREIELGSHRERLR